ncbi:hypothetical protein C3Y87_19415 [Carbonactinospora thermoautotrophica]|uniref:hypothetical protein n=1 Tax=Carbonactinospora thermoautotrophica TaxID=1469144 RepID=UPI0022717E38|nr:hypothetical protein [Carbonactinospora thermoautotrophica]MCX9193520.1 hypothetical protein [Carbonactinospora thermoautotrophica]
MEQAAETAARQAATEAAEHAAARAAQEAAEQAAATAGRQTATDVAAGAGRQAATDVAASGTGIRDALAAADQQAAAGLRESGATLANAEAKLDNLNLRSGAVEAPSATSVLERTPASESPPALYTPEDYDKWRAKVEEASPRHEEPLSRPAEQQPGHETSTGESNHDRTAEKTEQPERPQRPEKIDSEYLNRYFEYYDELDRRGIKLLHPGTEHLTFEPGGELSEGLTRIPPKDITEGSVRHVRPEDVYAGERYNSDIEDFEKRPVVWRYNENPLDEPLYRRVTVDPELIISKGMDVGDPKMLDLHRHQGNLTWEQSGLSSWTRSPEYAADFEREIFNPKRAVQLPDGTYMQVDYIWKGYHRGGIDMDTTWHDLRELNPYHEGEVTIPGGVRTEQLEGYWPRITIYTPEGQIVKTTFGDFVPNPNFKIEALIK